MEIGGKEYPVRFKYKALKAFTEKSKLSLSDLGSLGLQHIGQLLYFGLKSGHEYEKQKFTITIDQVDDWIDEDMGLISRTMEALSKDLAELGEVQAVDQ